MMQNIKKNGIHMKHGKSFKLKLFKMAAITIGLGLANSLSNKLELNSFSPNWSCLKSYLQQVRLRSFITVSFEPFYFFRSSVTSLQKDWTIALSTTGSVEQSSSPGSTAVRQFAAWLRIKTFFFFLIFIKCKVSQAHYFLPPPLTPDPALTSDSR